MQAQKNPHQKEEKRLWRQGYRLIAGVDESGCGPWAGPVVGAAVILNPQRRIDKIKDCKLLTPSQRVSLFKEIQRIALAIGVAFVDVDQINKLGIRQAALKAMCKAIAKLDPPPDFILVDAFRLKTPLPQKAIIHGDNTCLSIAAASVIAKVERDRMMEKLHRRYPLYGFNQHKGYGTKLHQARLARYGPCPIHRKSFAPIKTMLKR